ncbi:membrane protein [Bacteroidia bacterium]|nr:membrane protein [Bacteroidia bacterium]
MFNSCSDFLDIKSSDVVTGDAISADNLEALVSPLYNMFWYDFNTTFMIAIGDGIPYNVEHNTEYIGDFSHFTFTSSSPTLGTAWASLYNVVQNANKVIITINSISADETVKTQAIAEARFMRGLAYYYLESIWGDVIISDNPTPLVNNPIVETNPKKDVFEFALRDMEFAAKYLPETSPAVGRVNRYTAFGMLSRFYLDYSGYKASNYGENPNVGTRDAEYLELAKKAAEKTIGSGLFKLLDNYADLFKIEFNNNQESLFAMQWVPGVDGSGSVPRYYGLTNGQVSYIAPLAVTSGGEAWGSNVIVTYDMIKEYEPADTLRRKATWMAWGDFYPEINTAEGGLLLANTADGGYKSDHYGDGNTYLNVKKGVTGNMKDNADAINKRNSGLDNMVLRYAEVLLNYADAVLGNNASTSDVTALEYFNAVRKRAGLVEPKQSIDYETLRHERRIEFCMEGRYWYFVLARSYYRQQEVINALTGQDRALPTPFLYDAPNNLRLDPARDPQAQSIGKITAEKLTLPIPESDILRNPKLDKVKFPPVPYTFTEERITDLFN